MKHFKLLQLVLIIIFLFIIISGCTKNYVKITNEEYTNLKNTQEQYGVLSKNYTILKSQQNQCKNQLEDVSNILYNTLQYKEPIIISIPFISYKHTITYEKAGSIVKNIFWVGLITLLIDFIVGLFFLIIDKKKIIGKWIISISLIGFAIILVYITSVFS